MRTLLATMMVVALPAQAMATVYDFQATETSALSPSPEAFDFSLDTATATFASAATNFANVAIDANGTISSGQTVSIPFDTDIASSLFFFVDTSAGPFSSGTGASITFNPGSFAIADGLTDGEGLLTIASASVAAVAEPSALSLMLGGVLIIGVVGHSRSRRTVTPPV